MTDQPKSGAPLERSKDGRHDGPPSPAATVLLLRDRPQFEVLMVARHENSVFAGGALVFPGGRVDPGDRAAEWRACSVGLSADDVTAAAQVAAIRETFEEAGVLLAIDASGRPISGDHARRLAGLRGSVEADDSLFLDLVKREGLKLRCDALCLFSHWIAPPGLHRRFDSLFFAAAFPAGQGVIEDGSETTEALWIAPQEALDARQRGERKIIFPTACNLSLLARSKSADEVAALAATRAIRPITPEVVKKADGPWLRIPGDLGYPITEERLDFARPD